MRYEMYYPKQGHRAKIARYVIRQAKRKSSTVIIVHSEMQASYWRNFIEERELGDNVSVVDSESLS